tara:strand:+ start:93 stop:500 length:408 start_codon:yes stop_codon:yes gene_type:complete
MSQFGEPKYGITKVVRANSINELRPKVEQALKEVGFGILTEIDVGATLKKKIDVDFRPYLILGACHPKIAYQALSEEAGIGLLLPCNVVLSQENEGEIIVSTIEPNAMLSIVDNDEVKPFVDEVAGLLTKAFNSL